MDAQVTPDGFDRLFRLLDPILLRIASRIAHQCVDDALQQAHIRIWKKVNRVRIETVDDRRTAKSYIMQAAVSGMRDEVRRYLRQHHINGEGHGSPALSLEQASETVQLDLAASSFDFQGVLKVYKEYIEMTGDFAGAHKYAGGVFNISTAQASTRFHQAAKMFMQAWVVERADKTNTQTLIVNDEGSVVTGQEKRGDE